jgi:hypothetical protein
MTEGTWSYDTHRCGKCYYEGCEPCPDHFPKNEKKITMNNKTFILELAVKDEDGKTIHSINVTDFKLEETGLTFFDSMLKESKEMLFNILKKENNF